MVAHAPAIWAVGWMGGWAVPDKLWKWLSSSGWECAVPTDKPALGTQRAAAVRWARFRTLFRMGRTPRGGCLSGSKSGSKFGRMEERLCRKQGFSWLVDVDPGDDASGAR